MKGVQKAPLDSVSGWCGICPSAVGKSLVKAVFVQVREGKLNHATIQLGFQTCPWNLINYRDFFF